MALLTPDHLGSSTVLTNEQGAVIGRFSYRPFGGFYGPAPSPEPRALSDGAAIHHYFTGQELDASTDLYHLGARYYDPALGRFISPDPVLNLRDPQDGPYTYARNNPLRLIDPTGLSFQSNLGSGWGVGGFGSGLGDFVSGSLNQAWQNLTGWASQTWQGATNWATQTAQSLNQTVTSAMQSFSGLATGAHSFGQAAVGFQQNFGSLFLGPPLGFLGTASEAVNFQRSFGPDGVNALRNLGTTADIFGSNLAVKGGARASALELTTVGPFSRATVALDSLAASGFLGAEKDRLGTSFNLSGHLIRGSSEYRLFTVGGTTWSLYTESGFGGLLKITSYIDRTGGHFGLGGGYPYIFGPYTVGFELRFRNVERWEEGP